MSTSRFDRLERPRPEPSTEREDDPQRFGRFAPAPTGAPAPAAPTEPEPGAPQPLARFASDGSTELRVADRSAVEQPFVRCPRCGRDWNRAQTRCEGCSAPLDTDEVKRFNQQLWAELLEQRARDAAAQLAHAAEVQRSDAEWKREEQQRWAGVANEVKAHYLRSEGGPVGWVRGLQLTGFVLFLGGLRQTTRQLGAGLLMCALGALLFAGPALVRAAERLRGPRP